MILISKKRHPKKKKEELFSVDLFQIEIMADDEHLIEEIEEKEPVTFKSLVSFCEESVDEISSKPQTSILFQGLNDTLCEACEKLGWKGPTKIQAEALPVALQSRFLSLDDHSL